MSRGTLERKIQSPSVFLCLWADMWSDQKRQIEIRSKSAEYWKFPGCLQKNPPHWWWYYFGMGTSLRPYQLIGNLGSAAVQHFRGLFVAEVHGLWRFPVHWLRPLFSACGSRCGSNGSMHKWDWNFCINNFFSLYPYLNASILAKQHPKADNNRTDSPPFYVFALCKIVE